MVQVAGIAEAQEIFGGVPQEGDRLGSSDAPVSIQVFNDLQCSSCREDFLSTIPGLVEGYARPGERASCSTATTRSAKARSELGFYGAEAAAQQGYGWQYTYLFFRNQDEAKRFGIDQDFLDSIAGGDRGTERARMAGIPRRQRRLRTARSPSSSKATNELGTELGIRTRQAAIVSGPGGTRTLQDGPSLAQIEAAIEAVQ